MDKNSREYLQRNVSQGRTSLLLILVLTLVNIGMVLMESDRYFVCSISIPYLFCYLGKMEVFVEGYEFQFSSCLPIALVILGVFLAIWLLSKKRPGLLYAALVLFAVDTLALVNFAQYIDALGENIVDLLFHAWVLWELFQGARCGKKLENLPEEAPVTGAALVDGPTTGADFLKGDAAVEADQISEQNI